MKITEVSRQTGISTETLRYYDRIGLMPAIKRDQDGIRYYEQNDVEWISLVKALLEERISQEILLEFVSLEKQHQPGKETVIEEMCTCLLQHKDHIDHLLDCLHEKIQNG